MHNGRLEKFLNSLLDGDCLQILPQLPDDSIDLIITSPAYADQRKNVYGGVHPDRYVEWFLPIAAELKSVLKPSGSFILNIKERVVNGERHPYVLQLILEMRKCGWLWIEEYCWHKKNCYLGKWPNRWCVDIKPMVAKRPSAIVWWALLPDGDEDSSMSFLCYGPIA